MTDAEPPVLSVGAVLGGYDAENKAWRQAIADLDSRVAVAREGLDGPLRVNVVFHVPSSAIPNEHVGVRTGRFNKTSAHLMVQAAIPEGPVDNRSKTLVDLLEASIEEGERWAGKRGLSDQLGTVWRIVEQVSKSS